MDNREHVKNILENNIKLFNIPAPTQITLDRVQETQRIINSVVWITEKYNIDSIEEFIGKVKEVVNIKSKVDLSEIEKDILNNFGIDYLQDIALQPTQMVVNRMRELNGTKTFVETPGIEVLVGDMIDDVLGSKQIDPGRLRSNPTIYKEIVRMQDELKNYLVNNRMKFLFIDTETTSLINKYDRDSGLPIQISYILTDKNGNIEGADNFYISQKSISSGATEIHGIDLDKLNDLNPIHPISAYSRIKKYMTGRNAVVVAHNASFDLQVLQRLKDQSERLSGESKEPYREPPHICTLTTARKKISKGQLSSKKLTSLLSYYGYTQREILDKAKEIFGESCGPHDSRFDVVALMAISKGLGIISTPKQ